MSKALPMISLDNLEGWMFTPDQARRFHNDFNMLAVGWYGLEHLNATVRQCEETASRRFTSEDQDAAALAASHARTLARCAFDWYSVSACNLVSLIGWIANRLGMTGESHKAYLERVLPAVSIHRNKIAAHYARHSPNSARGKDSDAVQQASTMLFSLPQINGRFVANGYTLSVRREGNVSDSTVLQS